MAGAGYDVRLIMDATGNASTVVQHSAIADLTRYGVSVQGWIAIACELQADWAIEHTAKGLLEIFEAHNPPWAFLSAIQKAYSETSRGGQTA